MGQGIHPLFNLGAIAHAHGFGQSLNILVQHRFGCDYARIVDQLVVTATGRNLRRVMLLFGVQQCDKFFDHVAVAFQM